MQWRSERALDDMGAQEKAVKMLLNIAKSVLVPSKKQDFRKTLAECKQRISQSGIQMDEKTVESAANMAIIKNRPTLILHILRVSWWININIPTKVYENICNSLLDSRKWESLNAVLQFCNDHAVAATTSLLNMRLRTYLHYESYSMLQLTTVRQRFSKTGCEFDRETYDILIEASVANRDMGACRQIVLQMVEKGYQINEHTHRAILARMVAIGPNHDLESTVFTSLQGVSPSLDTAILNSLIQLRSIDRDDWMLRRYISHLRKGQVPVATHSSHVPALYWDTEPDITTISILIEHFGRRQQLGPAIEAFNLISDLKLKPTTEIIAHMIRIYASCQKLQEAFALAAKLSKSLPSARRDRSDKLLHELGWGGSSTVHEISSVTANVYILNALLKAVIGVQGLDAIVPILDLMEAHNVAPDDDTASILISFLDRYKKTNSNDIIVILYRLAQHPLSWRQRHVNVILHSFLREHKNMMFGHGGWKGASVFPNTNRERKVASHLSPSIYRRAENVFSIMDQAKRPEEAFNKPLRKILVSVDTSAARQDHIAYSIRMFYHARVTRDVEMVEELYRTMLKNDLLPNAYHVAALMEVLCIKDHVERAQEVLITAVSNGISVNRVLYTLLIRAFGNRGEPESGYRIYQNMVDNRVSSDIAALDAVVRGYFLAKDYATARSVLFRLWGTVLPLETLPPSTASLGEAMSHLRSLERMHKHSHPRFTSADGAKIKQITTKWRRINKRKFSAKAALQSLPLSDIDVEEQDCEEYVDENISKGEELGH